MFSGCLFNTHWLTRVTFESKESAGENVILGVTIASGRLDDEVVVSVLVVVAKLSVSSADASSHKVL